MSVPDTVRHGAAQVMFESYQQLGYNYRMTDIQAAVGREQLERLPESSRAPDGRHALPGAPRRHSGHRASARAVVGAQQLAKLRRRAAGRVRPAGGHAVPARPRDRDAARGHVHAPPATGTANLNDLSGSALRHSEAAEDHVILLPLFPGITKADQQRVADGVLDALTVIPEAVRL